MDFANISNVPSKPLFEVDIGEYWETSFGIVVKVIAIDMRCAIITVRKENGAERPFGFAEFQKYFHKHQKVA